MNESTTHFKRSDADDRRILVYDVGGSHISAALCVEHSYALLGTARAPLPVDGLNSLSASKTGPAFRFVRLIHALGERVSKSASLPNAPIAGAALAMPGPFDYGNGISQIRHKLKSLYGVDLKAALGERFGWQPAQLSFVNDAAAFLLGEIGAGAAKGFSRSIGITLGTGIGCAFAIDGRIAIPADQAGGDAGVPAGGEMWNLPYNGASVEDFVSTRFLRSRYQNLSGLEADVAVVAAIAQCNENEPCVAFEEAVAKQAIAPETRSERPPTKPSGGRTAKAAARTARQAFADFGTHLALALNQHAAAFHPHVVVLGGGIARASNLFLPATQEALSFPVEIAISTLMDEAPLAGAGVHWFTADGR